MHLELLSQIFKKFLHQSKLFLKESNSNESVPIYAAAGLAGYILRCRFFIQETVLLASPTNVINLIIT